MPFDQYSWTFSTDTTLTYTVCSETSLIMQKRKILLVFLVGYVTNLQAETLAKRSNTPVADSKPNPCQNGGTYTRIDRSSLPRGPKFICTCPKGFSGIVCQFHVCDKNDCQNGTCEADQTSTRGYRCNCIEGYVGENCEALPMDCKQIQESGTSTSGVYQIFPDGDPSLPVKVFCDLETQGGGWTAIQRRVTGSVDFNRVWDEYKNGFGNTEGDFWIGNDKIHQLTKGNDSSLYVSINQVTGITMYELYDQFAVSDEAEKYRLFLGGAATGTLGDRMRIPGDPYNDMNGMYFSTKDRDNDKVTGFQCAVEFGIGGWWYNGCHNAFLNGPWASQTWRQPWIPAISDGANINGTLMMVRRV